MKKTKSEKEHHQRSLGSVKILQRTNLDGDRQSSFQHIPARQVSPRSAEANTNPSDSLGDSQAREVGEVGQNPCRTESLRRQVCELELLQIVYSDEVSVDEEALEAARRILQEAESSSGPKEKTKRKPLSFSVRIISAAPAEVRGSIQEAPFRVDLKFSLPKGYPEDKRPQWSIDAPYIQNYELEEVQRVISETAEALTGQECIQPLCEAARERILQMKQEAAEDAVSSRAEAEAVAEQHIRSLTVESALGRRCVYFHHILCIGKRQCISHWARSLGINGFAKIGYPGILVVEGGESALVEYIRCLQRLRWKLMVVRGEETVEIPQGKNLDSLRQIPFHGVIELADSSEIGECCRQCGLEDLFRTCMRMYHK